MWQRMLEMSFSKRWCNFFQFRIPFKIAKMSEKEKRKGEESIGYMEHQGVISCLRLEIYIAAMMIPGHAYSIDRLMHMKLQDREMRLIKISLIAPDLNIISSKNCDHQVFNH